MQRRCLPRRHLLRPWPEQQRSLCALQPSALRWTTVHWAEHLWQERGHVCKCVPPPPCHVPTRKLYRHGVQRTMLSWMWDFHMHNSLHLVMLDAPRWPSHTHSHRCLCLFIPLALRKSLGICPAESHAHYFGNGSRETQGEGDANGFGTGHTLHIRVFVLLVTHNVALGLLWV